MVDEFFVRIQSLDVDHKNPHLKSTVEAIAEYPNLKASFDSANPLIYAYFRKLEKRQLADHISRIHKVYLRPSDDNKKKIEDLLKDTGTGIMADLGLKDVVKKEGGEKSTILFY